MEWIALRQRQLVFLQHPEDGDMSGLLEEEKGSRNEVPVFV